MGSEEDYQAHIDAARVYLEYAKNIQHRDVRSGLIHAAYGHFKKAGKLVKDNPVEKEATEIYMALAKSLDKPEKAIKALSKLYEESTGQNEPLFAFAFCSGYIESGQMKEAERYYERVAQSQREDLLASLRIKMELSD